MKKTIKKMSWFLISLIYLILLCPSVAAQTGEVDAGGTENVGTQLRLPIVMYHHMSEKSRLWNDYVLPVDQFERDLIYLKEKGYESIGVTDLLAWCAGKAVLPEKPVMITFDDGYKSTLCYAVPLLEEYGFKGVVAVIGSVCDLFTEQEDHNLDYAHLSWEDTRKLSFGDVLEVQCHTFNMHKLSPRKGCNKITGETFESYHEKLVQDLELFEQRCEEYGVKTCPSVAFPFGFFSEDSISILKEQGFLASFTCLEVVNKLSGSADELYTLGRYNRAYGKSSGEFFDRWEVS